MPDTESQAADPLGELATRAADEASALERELAEIDMLLTQARAEATRHEQKRSQAAERGDDPAQLVTLTRRAAVMEAQVDVLEGKRRALARYREAVAGYAEALAGLGGTALPERVTDPQPAAGGPSPQVSRLVHAAQEDLRREIARQMHDGPAQSLTNIVLQAQIVERLIERDPEAARREVSLLESMVQQTLDATKNFIFEVRPMVLDDLGLVPTLRRAARERGRRAGVAVQFDSMGTDRRLPMELESTLFRILDEALSAYLAASPEQVALRLDWSDVLEATVSAGRSVMLPRDEEPPEPEPEKGKELPPALAEMFEQRRADREARIVAAQAAAIVSLPDATWRDLSERAATVGIVAELHDEGGRLRLVVPLSEPVSESAEA